ncbi:hypothetical protein BD769DRAFT_1746695 [Suillus cothurnatus]|nr:hypothetical protein BD769DRAFT_1746695 [Suillus cothurnatus]
MTEHAGFWSTTIPIERTRFFSELDVDSFIGPYPNAINYFGDIVLPYAGHIGGHVNILVHTSAGGSWILGGDSARDFRLITGEKEIEELGDSNSKVQVLITHDVAWYKENKGGPAFYPGVIPAKA